MADRYFKERQRLVEITLGTSGWQEYPSLVKEVRELRRALYHDGRKLKKIDPKTFDVEVYKDLIRQGVMKTDIREALGWGDSKLNLWTQENGLHKYQILREAGLMNESQA